MDEQYISTAALYNSFTWERRHFFYNKIKMNNHVKQPVVTQFKFLNFCDR